MHKKLFLFPIILLLIPNFAYAQTADAQAKYSVGIHLENIGSIDRQNGSYDLIFWLILTSDTIDFTKNPPPTKFDFTNGHADEISDVVIEPHFCKFKVKGTFYNSMDFRSYPFEKLDLAIHMEPYYPATQDKMVFTVNQQYSGLSTSESTSVPGWNLGDPRFTVSTEKYPWGNFTHYAAHYKVSTTDVSAFMKKLFPVLVLMGFSFASFLLSPKNQGERLAMISASLLSAVFYHTGALLSDLPPLGYLTIGDKVMVTAYTFFIICLTPTLLSRYYTEIKSREYVLAQQIALDKKISILAPTVAIALFAILYFTL